MPLFVLIQDILDKFDIIEWGVGKLNMAVNIMMIIKDYIIIALVGGVIAGYLVSSISGQRIIGMIAGILIAIGILFIPYLGENNCEQCGAKMQMGYSYCQECGAENNSNNITGRVECSNCNRKIDGDSNICGYCGASLK